MKTATVRQIRNSFPAILRRVERGETVTITKRGQAVAAIAPLARRKPVRPWADREERLLALFPEPIKGAALADIISRDRD